VYVLCFAVRALGDKSELPLLAPAPLLIMSASDNADDVDTGAEACAGIESELSVLAVCNTLDSAETNVGSHSVIGAECEDVSSSSMYSVSVSDADGIGPDVDSDAATSISNCETAAEADLAVSQTSVGSDSKGEISCVLCSYIVLISSRFFPSFCANHIIFYATIT